VPRGADTRERAAVQRCPPARLARPGIRVHPSPKSDERAARDRALDVVTAEPGREKVETSVDVIGLCAHTAMVDVVAGVICPGSDDLWMPTASGDLGRKGDAGCRMPDAVRCRRAEVGVALLD